MEEQQHHTLERRLDRVEDRQTTILARLEKIEQRVDDLENLRWRFTASEDRLSRLEKFGRIGDTNGGSGMSTQTWNIIKTLIYLLIGRLLALGGAVLKVPGL